MFARFRSRVRPRCGGRGTHASPLRFTHCTRPPLSRARGVGALAINVPSIYWATLLPTGALVIGILALAAVGALLGAFTGWAVATGDEPEARVWPEVEEWLAA